MIPTHKLNNEQREEIRILQLGSLTTYNISEPHRHDYIELFIFDNGGGLHEIDFVPFTIEKKSIHLVSSGRIHQMKRALDSNGYVILFHPSVFDFDPYMAEFFFELDCFDVNEIRPCFVFNDQDQQEVMAIAHKIWQYSQSDNKLKSHFIRIQLNLLCLLCSSIITKNESDNSKDQTNYLLFRQNLRSNYKTEKKVNHYAAEIGITPRKLNEIVVARAGINVSKLIQKQIILEAKRLLNSGISSKEIAYALNFEDPAHFSKFFKTQTKLSPSDFQKVHD